MNRWLPGACAVAWGVTVGGCGGASPGDGRIGDAGDAGRADGPSVSDSGGTDAMTDAQLDAQAVAPDGLPAPAGEAIDTVVGTFDTHRTQIADIVPLGDSAFVVGYRDPSDRLKYVRWGASGRLGSAEIAGEGALWMRADTTDGFSRADPGCPREGNARVNTMAIQLGGDTPTVRLDVHRNCDGEMTVLPVPIADGVRPSSATVPGTATAPARTLVVYGRGPQLVGRFVVHATGPGQAPTLEDEFPIARFTLGGAFSTDVIHNRHSNRFIVGFIQRGGFGCSVWNVVLDAAANPPPVVGGPTQFGGCDGDQGGHHTSVAYNPLGDGSYAWWRQDMALVKSVFIHDASGAATSPVGLATANAIQFGNLWTTPVAATGSAATPYVAMFGRPQVHLFDMDAAGGWVDRVPDFGPTAQVALRAFPAAVVGLVRAPEGPDFETGTETLRLLQAPFPLGAQSHMPTMWPSVRR